MADQEQDKKVREYSQSSNIGESIPNSPSEFREETACELVGPVSLKKSPDVSKASVETSKELAVVPVKKMTTATTYRVESASEVATPVKPQKAGKNLSSNYEEAASEVAAPVKPQKAVENPPSNREETAAEIAAPVAIGKIRRKDNTGDQAQGMAQAGTGIGVLALALSIISLFVMPILFGAAGIILGFISRAKGANTLGAWAIGIGIVSIVIGIFIIPFF